MNVELSATNCIYYKFTISWKCAISLHRKNIRKWTVRTP